MIVAYADLHHRYIHDVMENATREDLTHSVALRAIVSEERKQQESIARTRAAAHKG